MLHHDNQARAAAGQLKQPVSDSEEDVDLMGESARRDSARDFELKDLSHNQHASENDESPFEPDFEHWQSDGEKSPDFSRARRASASTVQSFVLYTPDEERSVIQKFDRKLVLFLALLYMLSFLDRSSRCRSAFASMLC